MEEKIESKLEKEGTKHLGGGEGGDKRGDGARITVKGARSVPQKHQLNKHLV